MNEIRQLQETLLNVFPTAKITLDEPLVKNGIWSLDVFLPDYHLAIAWQDKRGFGLVANETHGYGEGADEVYEDLVTALPRVVELLTHELVTGNE